MRTKNRNSDRLRRLRPTPALIVAFVALFAAMGGFGYAAGKLKPHSVKAKNIKDGAVTTAKIADGAVTTPKLSPDAVAPNATNAVYAMNAARLGGAAPGECQTGWLKASMVVDTSILTPAQPDTVVPGFDCASKADDAIQIHRDDVGRYTVTLAGLDSGTAISSSAGANAVTAASKIDEQGGLSVRVWNNSDAAFVDGKTFSLIAF
jgi:hypothetical protein